MAPKRPAQTLPTETERAEKTPRTIDEGVSSFVELNQELDYEQTQLSKIKGEKLWKALQEGNVDYAALLVRSGADLTIRKYNDERTLLHEISTNYRIEDNDKREELARLMLDHGADVNAIDKEGFSVLRDAVKVDTCSSQLVEELLKYGARVTISKDHSYNDLFWATSYKPELLPRLVEHQVPDVETRNLRGAMAIDYLMSVDHIKKTNIAVDLLKQILDLGVPANANRPYTDMRLLRFALFSNDKNAIKALLDYGADPRQKDIYGHTPLYTATALKSDTNVSRWLVEKGVSIHDRNDDGAYPIHGACGNDSLRNIHLLINLGADMNCTDSAGRRPIQYMRMKSQTNNESGWLVIKHLALNAAKGMIINNEDLVLINENQWSMRHLKKCQEELERMKEKMVYRDVTYFSLFTRNIKSMLQLMKNQNFVASFKKDEKSRFDLFPRYVYMLLHSFGVAEKRLDMLIAEKKQLQEAFEVHMPDHIMEIIAFYFSYEKLQHCQQDYYMTLHENLKNTDVAKIM